MTVLMAASLGAGAQVDKVDSLASDRTPVGALLEGNASGSIPAWTGGLATAPEGFEPGGVHVDPYADETPLLRVSAGNIDEHAGHLTPGQMAMLRKYADSWFMDIYPSHRSAAFPQRIYDKTAANAKTGRLTEDGEGVLGVAEGFPFPDPQNGRELIWNHKLKYKGLGSERRINLVNATANGRYQAVKIRIRVMSLYHQPGATLESIDNKLLYLLQSIESPARLAGTKLLVHETVNQAMQPRHVWTFNPSQRRVIRAPNVAYDNPSAATDGLAVADMADMFNGAMDRFDWELKGKREIYVPYNAYRANASDAEYAGMVLAGHLQPSMLRYELHRVWVVEATLREGYRHINPRRTYYLDEDSYQVLLAEHYDRNGELWRFSEAHPIVFYDVPTLWTTIETHHDLQSGRYVSYRLDNRDATARFDLELSAAQFSPQALRRRGR
ncbi:MAG: DUF1329 domain-containing protein [Xanthomonadales bacterium]|nr:DUF1329 domain-containing protein [Gammaproteobacteria bacterium]NNK03741.1 DUF1329 domain-containing protein [Xanthomonadales bacterium]